MNNLLKASKEILHLHQYEINAGFRPGPSWLKAVDKLAEAIEEEEGETILVDDPHYPNLGRKMLKSDYEKQFNKEKGEEVSAEDLINSIHLDRANLESIRKYLKISGTLYLEIKRIMHEYRNAGRDWEKIEKESEQVKKKRLIYHLNCDKCGDAYWCGEGFPDIQLCKKCEELEHPDLKQMEKQLDEALSKETPESLNNFLDDQRKESEQTKLSAEEVLKNYFKVFDVVLIPDPICIFQVDLIKLMTEFAELKNK